MKSHILPISILFFLVLIFFHKIIFTDQLVRGVDIIPYNLSVKAFLNNAITSKESPLWDPYTYCGIPVITKMQPAVFYPLDIIFHILSLPIAINICTWFHIFLAGVFTYFFARELGVSRFGALISGILFSFNGYQFAHLISGHTPIFRSLPWIPAILCCLERSISKRNLFYALTGGILLAVQILTGYPQITFYILIAVVFYSMFKGFKNIGFSFVIIGIGLLAGAIQVLPVIEIMPYTTKCSGASFDYLNISSFPPFNLLTFIIPEIFGDGIHVTYWGEWFFGEVMGYMGILPLIAITIALCLYRTRITMLCLVFMLIFLLIAFGGYLPLAESYYRLIPGFNIFRCSARAMVIFNLFGAILSGYGISWIVENPKRLRGILKWLMTLSLIYGIIVTWFCLDKTMFWYHIIQLMLSSGRVVEASPAFLLSMEFATPAYYLSVYGAIKSLIWLIISIIVLYLWSRQWLSTRLFKAVAVIILVIDLWLVGYKYIQTVPFEDIQIDQETIEFLKKDKSYYRICMLGFLSNVGQRYGLCQADGYEPSIHRRYSELTNLCNNMPLEKSFPLVRFSRWHNLYNLLNIKYIVGTANIKITGLPHIKHVFSSEHNSIYQNFTCFPRAFIVHDFELHKPRDVLKRLAEGSFDPLRSVIIEEKPSLVFKNMPANTKDTLKILKYSLNEVIIQAELEQPGILVLTDSWNSDWQAYIDDKKARIHIADYVFRAIELTAGKHQIRFVYQPKSILYGMIITLVTLGLVVIVLSYWIRKVKN
ncbi:MAG: YfhO family protein [bacterium]|nr:YfhO family protein [bacterium]